MWRSATELLNYSHYYYSYYYYCHYYYFNYLINHYFSSTDLSLCSKCYSWSEILTSKFTLVLLTSWLGHSIYTEKTVFTWQLNVWSLILSVNKFDVSCPQPMLFHFFIFSWIYTLPAFVLQKKTLKNSIWTAYFKNEFWIISNLAAILASVLILFSNKGAVVTQIRQVISRSERQRS